MAGMSRETQMSLEASSMFPGFRFSPTDVELISYYLKKKLEGAEKCVEVISEIEICKFEPWDLPAKSVIKSENEWFFFSARGRKYPNGSQSRRATELGYWKATGKERNVKSGASVIGTKRTLVFHLGRAPKGERTEWIMHEYCMQGQSQESLVVCRLRRNTEFRMNDSSNRNSQDPDPRGPPTTHTGSDVPSEGGTDRTGLLEGCRAAECSKRTSSSYDSHSIEQFDSASESEMKLSNEATLAESSSRRKDSDEEEDFFADILKDDIIKLDETTLSTASDLLSAFSSLSEPVTVPQQPAELVVSQALPFLTTPVQGTSQRRIRLRQAPCPSPTEALERSIEENRQRGETNKMPWSTERPKCAITVCSAKTGYPWPIVVAILLILLVLLLSLSGTPCKSKGLPILPCIRSPGSEM